MSTKLDSHLISKDLRNTRFKEKIYGEICEPIIPKNIIGIWEPPSYLRSRLTCKHKSSIIGDGIDRNLDLRCFFTGVICHLPSGKNMDPKILPWMGTKDHLVPARRHVDGCFADVNRYPSTLVWTSNMVNVTLGLTPLLVRLKVRQWLMTIPYNRTDCSVLAGHNMKWLIIKLLDDFRINGRYPWSRRPDGRGWDPAIHDTFMNNMRQAESKFLSLSDVDRDQFIKRFAWRF